MKQLTIFVTVTVILVGTAQAQDSRTYGGGQPESTVRLGGSEQSDDSDFFGTFTTAREDPGWRDVKMVLTGDYGGRNSSGFSCAWRVAATRWAVVR
jgi:hypothetical protein